MLFYGKNLLHISYFSMRRYIMKKYIQLYNYFRDAIECGDWAPQMQLPTESALSEQFQMSQMCIRDSSSPSTVVSLVMCTNSMSIIQAQSFICSAVTS